MGGLTLLPALVDICYDSCHWKLRMKLMLKCKTYLIIPFLALPWKADEQSKEEIKTLPMSLNNAYNLLRELNTFVLSLIHIYFV